MKFRKICKIWKSHRNRYHGLRDANGDEILTIDKYGVVKVNLKTLFNSEKFKRDLEIIEEMHRSRDILYYY